MASENITLYIKGDRNVEVTEQDVFLKDIVSMECSDKKFLPKLQTVKILKLHGNREQRYVVSVLEIIACIHAAYPEVEVQNLGEAIIFFGSAFSIMAFNNDVGGTKLFGQIYELVMGKQSDGFTVLEVTYSIGLTFGILVFFNHFGKKRFTVDPTPMEVQMRLYENDIQTALVENASRRKEELEVGDR